jgi:hypothetical protein
MMENSEAFQMFQPQDYSLRLVTREAPMMSAPARIVG